MAKPPSTQIVAPVTKSEARDAKKTAAPAHSSGLPQRPARNEENNQRVMSELQALGVPALAVKVDVSARGELQPALKKVEETLALLFGNPVFDCNNCPRRLEKFTGKLDSSTLPR
jgi:hypothetical protein